MVVLGISGRRRDAAAALAIDGRLVAAVTEESLSRVPRAGYGQTGTLPVAAVDACLHRAAIDVDQVSTIVIVSERASAAAAARPLRSIDPVCAQAMLGAAAARRDPSLLVVVDTDAPGGGLFVRRDGEVAAVAPIAGVDRLIEAARALATALGCDADEPIASLEALAEAGEPEFRAGMAEAIAADSAGGIVLRPALLEALVARASAGLPASLASSASPNVRIQERRRALAASFHSVLGELLGGIAREGCERTGTGAVVLAGSAFSMSGVNTDVRRALGDGVAVCPVPEPCGRAIGAALAPGPRRSDVAIERLDVGPEFSEPDIKATLESCRLDYVYEPDWKKLLARVSAMLSRGKLVAWFQGALDFGPRSLGSRSVLADPSDRYARENIKLYLRRAADDRPLALSIPEAAADECFAASIRSPHMLFDGIVREAWRDRLRAVLDHRYRCPVHTVRRPHASELCDLLELHRERTGVPGLINTPLAAAGEPVACTPRDAVRTTFSTAIDALVIGRFLVMKDYWLLRSDGFH